MGTRILVTCFSQTIPGEGKHRLELMADMICRFKWGRPFDSSQDRLESMGQYVYNNNRCHFLVDNGPADSKDVSITRYKWDGKEFTELSVGPMVKYHLRSYPFGVTRRRRGFTDEEYRERYGEEEFKKLVIGRISQRRRWGMKIPKAEIEFLEAHPELERELS
ncbi:hypothetical protein L249_8270 [Ophiocordyceps polyrhachis-furcata BCC 54312]|uniref:Uncharacterized protein n=1 Tax=Ophiocordyceps polyrhachis-furcata BCC 54312 TaxID=1330021 RepID=A0A367LI78_9HYPO|nr:hypothetical protein L249_8270 [Ophiocordyceps polyrhachis-furcata BCC 54312]